MSGARKWSLSKYSYAAGSRMKHKNKEYVLRQLIKIWTDFDNQLGTIPIIKRLYRGKFRLEDYQLWLLNHRQQVIEGGRWIARAASSINHRYADIRSSFIKHAATEHKDYKMLEKNYLSVGGKQSDIENYPKNIGSEALSAFMFHKAAQPDPFQLLGAMFIIEGLGQKKATEWGALIQKQLNLDEDQVSFLLYHGKNDDDHLQEFERTLGSGILDIPNMAEDIIKTARVVAKLYQMQLEEIS